MCNGLEVRQIIAWRMVVIKKNEDMGERRVGFKNQWW
jgi:hypothetical protein